MDDDALAAIGIGRRDPLDITTKTNCEDHDEKNLSFPIWTHSFNAKKALFKGGGEGEFFLL